MLDIGWGLLLALWMSQPCQGGGPSGVGVEALRVKFSQTPLPLSACPASKEKTMKQVRPIWSL